MAQDNFKRLVEIVDYLRSPKGCPWDRKQKVGDLKNYILEEVYELCDAVDGKDFRFIREEIGDLFLLLVFFSSFFKEKRLFTADDALAAINKKLISRHPHVFAHGNLKTPEAVLNRWIKYKIKKKKRTRVIERIPKSAPALFSAYLFSKEVRTLKNTSYSKIRKEFLNSFKDFRRKNGLKSLADILFFGSCLVTLRNHNPETLLKDKVRKAASKILYGQARKIN